MTHVLDDEYTDELALVSQVTIKISELNWHHGALLYSLICEYALNETESGKKRILIYESGTGRGFSSVIMAKALLDTKSDGMVITVDRIPHISKRYWNSISDCEGPMSRQEILKNYKNETNRIMFICGETTEIQTQLHLDRIHFAFVDAQHDYESVMGDYFFIGCRQEKGDIIVFDDVSVGYFDGVVQAVNEIEALGDYRVSRIDSSPTRSYAVMIRN